MTTEGWTPPGTAQEKREDVRGGRGVDDSQTLRSLAARTLPERPPGTENAICASINGVRE